MQLSSYLEREQITYTEFARRIGAAHAKTVQRYAKRHQRPNAAMMRAIVRETQGVVSPNDFFDLPVDETALAG